MFVNMNRRGTQRSDVIHESERYPERLAVALPTQQDAARRRRIPDVGSINRSSLMCHMPINTHMHTGVRGRPASCVRRGKQDFFFFSPKFLCSNIFLSSKFRLKFREISWIKKKPSALRALSHSHFSGGCVCTIYHIFPLCAQEINKLFARSTVGKHPLK
jgi:hypothetical protein